MGERRADHQRVVLPVEPRGSDPRRESRSAARSRLRPEIDPPRPQSRRAHFLL